MYIFIEYVIVFLQYNIAKLELIFSLFFLEICEARKIVLLQRGARSMSYPLLQLSLRMSASIVLSE